MISLRYVVLLETLVVLSLCESGPFFTIEPQPVSANMGEEVKFECAANGHPPPRILWFKNSELIIPMTLNHINEITLSYNHKILKITGVRHEVDSGYYSCEADNMSGTIRSRKARLLAPFLLKDKAYFIQLPESNYVSKPGSGTIIPCQYDSKASWPDAQIFWRKLISVNRFENIESSATRFVSLTGTMVIAQTRPEDEGTYRCGARNVKMGTISESDKTKLTVERGPQSPHEARIYVAKPTQKVIRGQTATLECIPYGYPPPKITWSRENPNYIPEKAEQSVNSVLLTIPAFTAQDAGKYLCSAIQRNLSMVQRSITLEMIEPPEFPIPNRNLTITEGGNLVIPCDCSGNPPPSISWSKNSRQITSNIGDDDSLTLIDGKAITSGMYQCHAENEVGSAQATFAVKVIGPARIVSESRPKTIAQGTNVTLTCEAKGSPIPSIVWLKDGRALPDESRIRHQEDLYESTIYISNVQLSDNGVYECKALNENGDDSMQTKISVQGPPFINIDPKDTVGITGSDILVQCEATASPVPSVSWYRNEVRLPPSAKYEYAAKGLLVKNANAIDGGSFMCQADNGAGTASSSPIQVTVYNVPLIQHILPPSTNVTAGKTSLLLQCGITKDYSSYTWYKNGIPLLSVFYGDSVSPRIETRKGTGLFFYSVHPEDQGYYSCNVSNPAAKASTYGMLYVDVMPSISYISPSMEVREYETFWLDCIYEGMPKPDLQWTHDNAPIHRENTVLLNGTLRITSATRFDSGSYQCVVSNRQGSKKKDTIVKVRSKARIENFPSIQYPISGQRSTLTCEVSGYPFPSVEWSKNGERIDTYNTVGFQKFGTNLIITTPERSLHDGLYTCRANNDYGSDSQISKVEVLDMPRITRISGCGAVKAGLECKMLCQATGTPLPKLSWRYRVGNETRTVNSDNRRYFISLMDSQSNERSVAFTIKNLQATDSRTYFCHAENPAGMSTNKYELRVRYPAAIINPPLLNYEFPVGATLTISCGAQGEPKPAITWQKDKGMLPSNGRAKVDEAGSLIILNIQTDDEGEYICTANNNNDNSNFQFEPVVATTTVKITSKDSVLSIMDNPIETWLIVVIVICVFVVCIVVFVSVKMIRDRAREKRSYKPHNMVSKSEEPTYQYETVRPKPVMFSVPVDNSNSLPMYSMRTLNWDDKRSATVGGGGGGGNATSFTTQFDDVDRQLQGLLKDLDNPKLENLESDI